MMEVGIASSDPPHGSSPAIAPSNLRRVVPCWFVVSCFCLSLALLGFRGEVYSFVIAVSDSRTQGTTLNGKVGHREGRLGVVERIAGQGHRGHTDGRSWAGEIL